MISLENKKIEMYLYYISAYILTFFLDYVNRKNIKAEIYSASRYIKSAFFILKKIYMEVNGMDLLPSGNGRIDERFEIFSKENLGSIRTALIEGEPWFCLKDACDILGIKNNRDAQSRLNQKGVAITDTLTKGGKQKILYINESNLYKLIFNSRKPEAKKFEDWITSEVIPSIRKTGMYIRDDVWQEIMDDPKRFGELLIDYAETKKEKEKLQLENSQQKQIIAEYEPKVSYCDLVLKSPNAVPITLIAKDYGMSAIAFNKLLHDLGIQYKQSGTWLLYQEYAGFGYTKSSTFLDEATGFTKMNTKWTQKGRLFLYETLKANDILPLIEKE